MTKNKKIVTLACVSATALGLMAAFIMQQSITLNLAGTTQKSIIFDIASGENKFIVSAQSPADGTFKAKTHELKNEVSFKYHKAKYSTTNIGHFETGGYICNLDKIGSMNSVSIDAKAGGVYVFEWGWELASDGLPYYEECARTGVVDSNQTIPVSFNGEHPNYFRIRQESFANSGTMGFSKLVVQYSGECEVNVRKEALKDYKKTNKTKAMEANGYRNLIKDEKFRKGFRASKKEPYSDDLNDTRTYFSKTIKTTNDSDWGVVPTAQWTMVQWMSNSLIDPDTPSMVNKLEGTTRTIKDKQTSERKAFEYDYTNADGKFRMECNCGEEYKGINTYEKSDARGAGWWVHSLIEQGYVWKDKGIRLADCTEVIPTGDLNVVTYIQGDVGSMTTPRADTFEYYFLVQNLNETSDCFGRQNFWFGFDFFDNRGNGAGGNNEYIGGEYGTDAGIYKPGSSYALDNGVVSTQGATTKLKGINMLDKIKTGFQKLQNNGCMVGSNWEDLYITSFNIGYEIHNHYHNWMEFSNLGIYYK